MSVPIYDFMMANQEVANEAMETYYSCCGKSICSGCVHSFAQSGNDKCPFCNTEISRTDEEKVGEVMGRVEANDAASICMLATYYQHGRVGLQQDHAKAMNLFNKAAELGCSKAHNRLGAEYYSGGDMKKAKFHFEAAAMAGHEDARCNLGVLEATSGNMERAIKHWTIAASTGCYTTMNNLKK
jgi:TPR repeat protein